jgi:hypothetical protein
MAEDAKAATEAIDKSVNHQGTTVAADIKLWQWQIIGETVRGASHQRDGRPNQDAILQVRESGVYAPVILSISDGHGSNKCFRSHRGSRLAVTLSAQLIGELITERQRDYDAAKIESAVKETWPIEFVRKWKETVEADLKCEPFSKQELEQLENKDSLQARELVEAHPYLAYGATSLVIALTDSFIIYAQLGDGEIICVSETGAVDKPLPEDARLLANETTSLCTDSAAQDFRIAYQPFTKSLPALIILTTDGYANSFVDDAGFLKVGSDLLAMLRTDGFDVVNRSVRGWLEEATQLGSGDDCTLGIVCRMDALQRAADSPAIPVKEGVQQPASQEAPEERSDIEGKQAVEES